MSRLEIKLIQNQEIHANSACTLPFVRNHVKTLFYSFVGALAKYLFGGSSHLVANIPYQHLRVKTATYHRAG